MYTRIQYFLENYAKNDGGDQQAAKDFVTCETREQLTSLRAELTGIMQLPAKDTLLDKVIGKGRKARYNSYQEWARMMMIWLANARE